MYPEGQVYLVSGGDTKYRGEIPILFGLTPKTERGELFDREPELRALERAVKLGESFIVVKGVRRVGKSSILYTALNELRLPNLVIDVRDLYAESGIITREIFLSALERELNRLLGRWGTLRKLLKKIKGISLIDNMVKLDMKAEEPDLSELLDCLNRWALKNKTRLIIAFDEAQYLRFSTIRFRELIASSLDRRRRLTFILTGSEVGLLDRFIGAYDPDSPLYGRFRREILVERFTKELSLKYLRAGFKEQGVKVPREILEEVVEALDGIVGWLSLFGYWYVVERPRDLTEVKGVVEKFREEASEIVRGELSRILEDSPRYILILKAIAEGNRRWSEIYRYLQARGVRTTNKRFTELLKRLVDYNYIKKEGNRYVFQDPVTEYAVKRW